MFVQDGIFFKYKNVSSTLKSDLGEYLTFSEIKLTLAEKLTTTTLSALAGCPVKYVL
jgi:hypothetical protein